MFEPQSIDDLLQEAQISDSIRRMRLYALSVVWKRQKAKAFVMPVMVGIAIGALSVWWMGVIWGLVVFTSILPLIADRNLAHIQTHMMMRLTAKQAKVLADIVEVPLPEKIARYVDAPEFPPYDEF